MPKLNEKELFDMALLRCTKKLLAELSPAIEGGVSKTTLLGDWHANLLRIERRKCVLFTNDEILLSVFVPLLKKADFQNLIAVFLENLIQILKFEGFDTILEQVKEDYGDNLTYSPTNNRSVLGTMYDITRCLPFILVREGGLAKVDLLKINHEINRMPLLRKPYFDALGGLKQKLSQPPLSFKTIEHGSHDYKRAVCLREDILRKPLGLAFTCEELEKEKDHIHIIGMLGKDVCATAVLVPQGNTLKMQRVAVRKDLQNKGIASTMMTFCEDYATQHGFKEIYCHARQTAVPFYKKNDYLPEGEPFMETTILHLKMRKVL